MSRKYPSDPTEGTLPIERLLERISPGLSEGLDQVMQEFRTSLELEFDIRIKKALIEKQAEFRGRAEELRRNTEAETKEAVQAGVASALEARFKSAHDTELSELKTRLETQARQMAERLKTDHLKTIANERESVRQKVTSELEARFKPELESGLAELENRLQEEARQTTTRLKGLHAQAVAQERESVRRSVTAELEARLEKDLDKQLSELRERLEGDARQKVDKLNGQHAQAVAAERVSVRESVTADLNARSSTELKAALSGLETRLKEDAHRAGSQWKLERTELIEQVDRWRLLAEFQRRLGDASSQAEMLNRFLSASERFCSGVALYVNKPDGLELWHSKGETAAFPALISTETIDPEWYFAPVVIRSKTVAAICAAGIDDRDSLALLVEVLRKAVEGFGLRLRFFGSGAGPESAAVENSILGEGSSNRHPEEDREVRDEARLLARTLVAEIKLGHEEAVVEGRAHSDLYTRLQKEIDEGHEIYRRQVTVVGAHQDYFHEEVVKILAENNPERLGEAYSRQNN